MNLVSAIRIVGALQRDLAAMANRYCSSDVVSFFAGEESTLEDIIMDGSDDKLGMEDEIEMEEYDYLLEIGDDGKLVTIMHKQILYLKITGRFACMQTL